MVSVVRFFAYQSKMEHFEQKNVKNFSFVAHYIYKLNNVKFTKVMRKLSMKKIEYTN